MRLCACCWAEGSWEGSTLSDCMTLFPFPSLHTRTHPHTLPLLLIFTGTDILLGGNPDYMARLKLQELLMPEVVSQGELGAPRETTPNKASSRACARASC